MLDGSHKGMSHGSLLHGQVRGKTGLLTGGLAMTPLHQWQLTRIDK